MREGGGKWAGVRECVAEGVEGVGRDDGAGALKGAGKVFSPGFENPLCAARGAAQEDLGATEPAMGAETMAIHGAVSEFGGGG